jgi:cytidylate kinase
VTNNVRHLAGSPEVREVLVELQRRIGRRLGDFVTEGRDQGSVVFPDADVKFFIEADPAVRAQRRLAELTEAGEDVTHEEVLEAIKQRDHADRNRSVGPLRKPDGAIVVDTTNLAPQETLERLEQHVSEVRS